MIEPDICVYHGNCADGFGAAFAVWTKHGEECHYIAGKYDEPPQADDIIEVFRDKEIVFVDFCWKRDVMEAIADVAAGLVIIDHHKSAAELISDLTARPNVGCLFDLERSGAMLAWQYFHPDERIPRLFQHIQDRDLWKFELEYTREIQACVFSYPYDFDVWNELVQRCDRNAVELIKEGQVLERKHFKDIKEFLDATDGWLRIEGHRIPALNVPYMWSSDACQMLLGKYPDAPFSACYWKTRTGWQFSLRSDKNTDNFDVSEIAKKFGGGGHHNASGFTIPRHRFHLFHDV